MAAESERSFVELRPDFSRKSSNILKKYGFHLFVQSGCMFFILNPMKKVYRDVLKAYWKLVKLKTSGSWDSGGLTQISIYLTRAREFLQFLTFRKNILTGLCMQCMSIHAFASFKCILIQNFKSYQSFHEVQPSVYLSGNIHIKIVNMSDRQADELLQKLASGDQVDPRQVFRFELNRLHSFVTWPKEANAHPTSLARVGLYYLNTSDTVACFICNVHLGQWEPEDLPLGEHERHSPNCPFVRGEDVGNVPLCTNGQVITVDEIREQEDEIRRQRAASQSAGLSQMSNNATSNNITDLLERQLKDLSLKYPFSVLDHQRWRVTPSTRKVPIVSGSARLDSLLETTDGGTRSDSFTPGPQVQELAALGSDCTSRSPLSVRQQQINQAIISISTEPVRQGVTEYCPLDVLKSIMQSANHPQYAHMNRRMESYATWPYSHVQSPIKLAEAGFYYTGREDRIRCFLCNGGLCNWETEDIPWYEHSKWFERCRYMLACKRNPVVAAIVSTATQLRSSNTSANEGETQCDDVQTSNTRTTPDDTRSSTEPETRETASTQRSAASVTESTPCQQAAAQAAEERLPEHSGAAGVATPELDPDVKETCSGSEAKDETGRKKKKKNRKKKGKKNTDASPTREDEGPAAEPQAENLDKQTLVSSLREENESLRARRTCKVCMEKPVCIVFLPCSHLVCCLECAMQLNNCPVCRGPLKATVKVYI